MCDCAEEAERRRKLQLQKEAAALEPDLDTLRGAASPPPSKYNKKLIIALTTMLCGLLALLFSSLDRKTARKLLTMVGLGWLLSNPCVKPDPCPQLKEQKSKWSCPEEKKVTPPPIPPPCCRCDEEVPKNC